MNDNEFKKILKEATQISVKSMNNMGTYTAPAGANEIISKRSTDEGLEDIINKVVGGFAGDASKGSDPGKPFNPGEANKGGEANSPTSIPEKGEGTLGSNPENPKSNKKTVPMESKIDKYSSDLLDENNMFDENESKILQKLIEEIDKTEMSILDEMVSDEFDDNDESIDFDINSEDYADEYGEDEDLEISDPDFS